MDLWLSRTTYYFRTCIDEVELRFRRKKWLMDIDLENTKLRLIQLIMSLNDDDALTELERTASELTEKIEEDSPNVNLAVRPILSNISLDEIDKKQGYSPVSYEKFRKDADKLNLEEPVEELLTLLTK